MLRLAVRPVWSAPVCSASLVCTVLLSEDARMHCEATREGIAAHEQMFADEVKGESSCLCACTPLPCRMRAHNDGPTDAREIAPQRGYHT
eukprot:6207980-Pleurochrysis_carterae.AAC.1